MTCIDTLSFAQYGMQSEQCRYVQIIFHIGWVILGDNSMIFTYLLYAWDNDICHISLLFGAHGDIPKYHHLCSSYGHPIWS